nr:unnamed protein product [Spirometra erinaceieuropaei]
MFSATLMDTNCDEHPGMRVVYRKDDQLFNQGWMHFQSYAASTSVHELLFTDDCTLNATSERDVERSLNLFAAAFDNFGLFIDTQKTVVLPQPLSDADHVAPQINVSRTQLQVVDNFTYLGCTLSRNTKIDDEVACRISKASQAFCRL